MLDRICSQRSELANQWCRCGSVTPQQMQGEALGEGDLFFFNVMLFILQKCLQNSS